MPELVVEVLEPNESTQEADAKAREYIAAGVKVVWNIEPVRKCVTEFRNDQERVFTELNTLTIEDVIPGFLLPVSRLFE